MINSQNWSFNKSSLCNFYDGESFYFINKRKRLEKVSNFNDKIEEIVYAIFSAEDSINQNQAIKKQCDIDIKQATSYIGELKAELKDLMGDQGVVSTDTSRFKISIKSTPISLIIDDEASIPEQYLVIKKAPIKKAILKDLKLGVNIPGVKLNNGGETIQIKVKNKIEVRNDK